MGTTTHAPTGRITCPTDHKHGTTRTCYIRHGCRCRPCLDYAAHLAAQRRRNKAYGRPTSDLIPAEPTREHLLFLREWGYGYRRLEELTGLGQMTIRRHLAGTPEKVSARVAERVLAVKPTVEGLAPGTQIPVRGVKRRLWALRRLGWNSADVARHLGCERKQIAELLTARRMKVTARWHQQIDAVYEELSMTIPEPTPVRRRVMKLAEGKPGPLDWDDIDADPTPPKAVARPSVEVIEREEKVRGLHHLRWSDAHIAAEMGIHDRTVIRIRQRLGLPGWTKEQQEAAA